MIFEKSQLYYTAVSRHSPLYYKTASQASNSNISVNEIKFENIFGGLSGPQMELFYEKKGGEKYHDTVPLNSVVRLKTTTTLRWCESVQFMFQLLFEDLGAITRKTWECSDDVKATCTGFSCSHIFVGIVWEPAGLFIGVWSQLMLLE